MADRILVIDAHPDPDKARFCHALASYYVMGARDHNRETRVLTLADMQIPYLRTAGEFMASPDNAAIRQAQHDMEWADHIVFIFPLWLGGMPGLLKSFLEQVARGGFLALLDKKGWRPHLKGKTARVIVTMGMPAIAYRFVFGAHGLKSMTKSILRFAGIGPIKITLFGAIEAVGQAKNTHRRTQVRLLGFRGE